MTKRELEILKLIASGKNNGEIWNHLVISEHTVMGHASNILSKLHLADRIQAAVYVWKQGVVQRDLLAAATQRVDDQSQMRLAGWYAPGTRVNRK